MFEPIRQKVYRLLRWSEKYTKADMVYLVHGNFWLITGRAIAVGSGVLLTVAFANLLSPTDFGTYKYILAIAGFVGAFSLGGLNGAVTRAIAQGHWHVVRGVFRTGFMWCIPASVCAAAGSIYYFYMGNTTLGTGLLLIAVTNPFLHNFVFYKSVLLGAKDFRGLTFYGLPRGIIPIVAIVIALLLTENVLVIIATYFLSNLIVGWIVYELVLKKFNIRDGQDHKDETISYGKHLSVMGITSQMVGNIDQLLLWHLAGPVQLAIYSFALAPIREIRNFSENIFPLIFPKYATKTVEEMKQTVPLRIKQLLIVSIIIAAAYIFLAPLMYKFIFPQYIDAIFASQLLAAALILQPRNIVETMLFAQGNVKLRYVTVFVTQGAKVILWVILIPLYGFMGAVIGTVVTDIVSSLALWWAYKKLV
ncbi:hypothetical protein A2673_03675 [Candidatus Kaiserbacteria bacterium RIFCSPHIGHO2_01_FULL_50_13]|uniref:Polysaccharide biosynthesis protein C-terminal domain-containing protein n=1 Tax=Candidatus Kaiserbacteria bacterium RIFCSPLOWO2_01_FULL_50_24 TaxID=1798507 RepID=A0A1F6EIU0_9BACT|nr:MAG: hypothetical protein A2673_03675 [Candidatus Kaiserbacteria bacterium RIFCSPHIGHO2_01_FULL_50_13]OGG73561.1 MAG: hypothetical protein A3A34_02695 [Candidatus Kaiserbacteria bacterium RIFCSPLOWO2_01_FULL_50_24]OGG82184.1 MAG: hypothetical protein A3H74_03315 [Candidatus Kaiserbacteria bacterium RIFCSPLOWO2_02_FULL_51_13]